MITEGDDCFLDDPFDMLSARIEDNLMTNNIKNPSFILSQGTLNTHEELM